MNEELKQKIMRMFGEREDGASVQKANASGDAAGGLILREAVELLAPVFWITSVTKMFDVFKQVLMFALGVLGFYQVFHWFVSGVPASWWLVLQVPLALVGLMAVLAGVVK